MFCFSTYTIVVEEIYDPAAISVLENSVLALAKASDANAYFKSLTECKSLNCFVPDPFIFSPIVILFLHYITAPCSLRCFHAIYHIQPKDAHFL